MIPPLRLAVVGGQRGGSFTSALDLLSERVRLTAICDLSQQVRQRWSEDFPGIHAFERYETLLESDACDAVIIATPMSLHARQSVQALRAGKHVLSEVAALMTMDEAWELIDTVEQSGLTYMLAENCCYMRDAMMVLEMAGRGAFGAITVADCGYIHDCRSLMFYPDGSLTWRGQMLRDHAGCLYPTHSIGPLMQWLKAINPSDRLVSLATFASGEHALHEFAAHHFSMEHPAAQPGFFKNRDNSITLLQTAAGVMVTLRLDMVSPRPWNNVSFVVQGTKGAYHRGRHTSDEPAVWFEATKPPVEYAFHVDKWDSLWNHADAYEHPYWREWGEAVTKTGHGGSDFFSLLDFSSAVLNGTRPPIDVYDAVEWSCIVPLSEQSLLNGNRAVEIPDFRKLRSNA